MNIPNKPETLYHASSNSDIDMIEPRAQSVRDEAEGPVVFATPSLAQASMFLVNCNNSWTECGRFNDVFYMVISDRDRFFKLDKGGCIYTLPSDTFYCDTGKGLSKNEWVSKEHVKPISKQCFKSALKTMINNDVQVYFVDPETFHKIQDAEDHGFTILQSIQTANTELEKQTCSAGGVVINKDGLVLVVNQDGRTWSLPKGHIDDGEDAVTTAQREIYEESGITELELIKKLGNYQRYRIGKYCGEDKSELKQIFMFLFRTSQTVLKPVDPHNPEARWVQKDEVASLLTHPKDKEFFLSVVNEI